jgi:outer membrane protein
VFSGFARKAPTFFLLFSFLLSPFSLSAQKTMSLEECMRYAVANSYKTARAATELDNAKKDYTRAALAHLPEFSGSIGVNSSFGRSIDPATNNPFTTTALSNDVGLYGRMPLFNGLRYLNQTLSAKLSKLRGEEQLRQTRDKVAEETMIAYAEVVYNTELLELYEKRIDNYKIEEKKMARLLELGGGSSADLAQIRATLASEEYTAIAAKKNLELSIVKLKDCMNFPLDETLLIEPQIKETELYWETQTAAEIIAFATNKHPVAIIGLQYLNLQKYALSMARGSYYPSLSLNSGINTGYFTSASGSFFTQYKNYLGEYLGVHLSVPIFSGLDVRLRVAKAKNDFKQAQRDYDETLRTLSSEISQALLELEAAKSMWLQAQKNVEYQQIANNANKRRYNDGALSIIELQTSDNQLFLSEIELRDAWLRYQIKVREVNYYKGVAYSD